MSTDLDRIRDYYAGFDEWGRLDGAAGELEFRRALEAVRARLAPGSRVLDLGGGPGRYAFALAEAGYDVVLADLAPVLLEVARRKAEQRAQDRPLRSIDEVDAQDLSRYGDGAFDAVLAFGPFYHLVEEGERRRAAREIHRVLRAEGTLFATSIQQAGGLVGLIDRAASRPEQVPARVFREAAATGRFRNAASSGFQEGYYAAPGELEALLAHAGFVTSDLFSLRSLAYGREQAVADLTPELRAEVERELEARSRDAEILATCGPVLWIGRRA